MEGMIKEVNNLNQMGTGDLLTVSELQRLEKKFPGTLKVIPSRWVATRKTPTTVRARLVIKDIAGKNDESARALGFPVPLRLRMRCSRFLGLPVAEIALLQVQMLLMLSWLHP